MAFFFMHPYYHYSSSCLLIEHLKKQLLEEKESKQLEVCNLEHKINKLSNTVKELKHELSEFCITQKKELQCIQNLIQHIEHKVDENSYDSCHDYN